MARTTCVGAFCLLARPTLGETTVRFDAAVDLLSDSSHAAAEG